MKTLDELVCKFNEIYPNLPLGERRNTIAVVKGEPLSWKIVKLEINTPCPTKIGTLALRFMENCEIL